LVWVFACELSVSSPTVIAGDPGGMNSGVQRAIQCIKCWCLLYSELCSSVDSSGCLYLAGNFSVLSVTVQPLSWPSVGSGGWKTNTKIVEVEKVWVPGIWERNGIYMAAQVRLRIGV